MHTSSKSSSFGISAGINSPILDRAKQVAGAVSQVKNGDTAGGAMEAINAATGTIKGLADNQGTRQTNYDANGSVGKQGAKNASANNNFYANIGVNAGISKSKSTSNTHTENAVVTTMKPADENSSITYNNVNNITYQGTQAQGGTFIYNNVANIQKEAVELHNSYTSSSSSRGINAGATIGYGHKIQTTGNGGSISVSRSNRNTVETIHANGNFTNVNEVHNNTGTMTLSGFNQEGGKVTGNIGNLVVESRQNTSTTTGSSKGMSVGVSSQGIPTSVNVNASRTNGNRAFVDNQSTFVVGEGSNLHVGTVENTGAVIGKEGNSTFKIDTYAGKDIQNYDTMTTTGGSIGASLGGKPKITNVGFNQDSRDKQGITRNTVVGDVEIAEDEGSPINRDLGKANEITKDTHSRTNINVEPQVIEYLTNPGKLKEDIGKAKKEISDVTTAIKESIHDRGDDNRNFFGQLREVRLSKTVNNIAGKRLTEAQKSEDVVAAWKDAYKDLGYNLDVKYTTGEDTPEMKDKAGTAYVSKDGVHTIIININAKENSTKAGLIGTLAEEASHIVNGVAGRQIATGTKEKGLESTGRASNAYFQEEYKGNNQNMTYKSDGKIDTSKLGTNVGEKYIVENLENYEMYKTWKYKRMLDFISQSSSIFKDENGKYYNVLGEIETLIKEHEDVFNDDNTNKEAYRVIMGKELTDKENKNVVAEVWKKILQGNGNITVDKEGKLVVEVLNKKDFLTNALKLISESDTEEFIRINIENAKSEKKFLDDLKKKIDDSDIPKEKKDLFSKGYTALWKSTGEDKWQELSKTSSLVDIYPDDKEKMEINIFNKNENGEIIIDAGTASIFSKIGHETGHILDKIIPRNKFYEMLEKVDIKVFEKEIVNSNGKKEMYVYSSNRYTTNYKTGEISFYPIKSKEFVSVTVENEVNKKLGDLQRANYDAIEEEKFIIKIPYKSKNTLNEKEINSYFEKIRSNK